MEAIYEKFLASGGISTDSREDLRGKMYLALKGESFDGNQFVEAALEKGALFAVTTRNDIDDARVIVVEDTLKTLQELARMHRSTFSVPVIAIGGSNGKTTTKELVVEVLAKKYRVLKTEGNLNNYIGVAKTLLRLNKDHTIAVIEVGANSMGEHPTLLDMARPTHVLVTNNGLDHLAGFGSPENVRIANGEIFEWATAHKAVAFVDEGQQDLVEDAAKLECVTYSLAQVRLGNEALASFEYKNVLFTSHLVGGFNAINMLAAVTVGEAFGVSLQDGRDAIASYHPSLMRSELLHYRGAEWVVDCYNANPSSMQAAIESFVQVPAQKRGFILGGMREMGAFSHSEHQKLVDAVAAQNPDLIILVGDEFLNCALPEQVQWFKDSIEAKKYTDTIDLAGYRLLLKGSRGIRMEKIIDKGVE